MSGSADSTHKMSSFSAPSETLSAVALRAFRSPVSGLATMLAAIAQETGADLVAAHLISNDREVELLAAGGSAAPTLGPPGKVVGRAAHTLADVAPAAAAPEGSEALAVLSPWDSHAHVLSTAIALDGSACCLLSIGGHGEIPMDALYASSAAVGLLAQMIVIRRLNDRLRQEMHDLKQGRFLLTAGLHHDLRGPLTSILGSTRTLLVRDEELNEETRAELLAGVAAQAERLSRMIDETLAHQGADPTVPVRRLDTNLEPMLQRVAATALASRPGDVKVECPEISVVTDPDRLERALLNLVDNALKYSPTDVPVHVIVEQEGDHVTVTVADNGPGVSSEVLPGLFGAYATDPTRQDGTGLGLHSARSLIEELGGRIGYSRHSEWTRFTLTLPRDGVI
jgi:signal transduction histidine kinase